MDALTERLVALEQKLQTERENRISESAGLRLESAGLRKELKNQSIQFETLRQRVGNVEIWLILTKGSSPRLAAFDVLRLLEDRLDRAMHKLLTSSKGFEAISSHVHQSFKPKKTLYTHVANSVRQLGDCPAQQQGILALEQAEAKIGESLTQALRKDIVRYQEDLRGDRDLAGHPVTLVSAHALGLLDELDRLCQQQSLPEGS